MSHAVQLLGSAEVPERLARELRALWDQSFGSFDDHDAAHAYGGTHAVIRDGDAVVAHGSAVPRRVQVGDAWWHVGYVEAVATRPSYQGRGLGTSVMRALAGVIGAQHDAGVLSTGSHAFYERLGWHRWQGPSYVVKPDGERVRTGDEDDGIMVLLTARTAGWDLTQPIVCEDRPGDAW